MPNLKRRHFILGSVGAAGALVIGWAAAPERRRLTPSTPLAAAPGQTVLNGWVKVSADNTVTVVMSQAEMGQGAHTGLAMLVSLTEDKQIRVHRVHCVIDCGVPVNPNLIRQQMESAIVYGLSAALQGEITIDKGRVQQSNFHDYAPLRIDECPAIEVEIIPSEEPPGGVGEPGT